MLTYAKDLTATPTARGERNNNPTNMDRGTPPIAWQGMAADQSQDVRFAVFTDAEHGLRAAVLNMRTQAARHKGCTLRQLISVWAPPSENNTAAYILGVARQCGQSADRPIDVYDRVVMLPFLKAVITHENGRCIYPDAMIQRAFALVGDWSHDTIVPSTPAAATPAAATPAATTPATHAT